MLRFPNSGIRAKGRPRPGRKESMPTEASPVDIGNTSRGDARSQGRRLQALRPQELLLEGRGAYCKGSCPWVGLPPTAHNTA
ncbi:hypothetical protein B296_00004166 [Ensete ventricosum]|uniref:Uncharacterized protein n=1 Tax=Ensete ventricosum TaxID=4639 RepID=A0A427ARS8_ENSVE|nr:hypothetical protein B296_00004166 [Ensete ventricosum]